MTSEALLEYIPDFTDWILAKAWIENRLQVMSTICFNKELCENFVSVTAPETISFDPVFGPFGSTTWRQFALGTFLADWICYNEPADRADFGRLLSVIAAFPSGFRLWFYPLDDGSYIPVGYTGWYPIINDVFELLLNNPANITHRGLIAPCRTLEPGGSYVYLFNYSIILQLRKTPQSRVLLKNLAEDLSKIHVCGMAAVTVSQDGKRVAERFGLRHTGNITHEGESEHVFAARL